jgi:hypothetical protein
METTHVDRAEFSRIVERFEVACAYIRARDILRLQVALGLDVSRDSMWEIKRLETRYDALAPKPRTSMSVEFPERVR